jgi:sodium/proline symporter
MTYKLIGVFTYLAVLVVIGVLASRRVKDVRDYFAAGKKLSFWSVAFSARATGESSWLLIGLTGMGATVGMHAFWVVVGEVVGVSLAWLWMSRRFKRLTDRYDSITIPDYLESRFSDKSQMLRKIAAFALCVFVTIYVAAQIHATGKAFHQFLQWEYWTGAFVGFGIVLLYSTSGGFLAVAWSDVFQGLLMFLGLVVLPIYGLVHVGGFGPMVDGLRQIDPNLLNWSGGSEWTTMSAMGAIGFVLIGVGFMGSPQIFVRFLALRDENEIKQGATVAIVWTVLADTGAVLIGMVGRVILEGKLGGDNENVLPLLSEFLFNPLMVGLMIAIVMAAIMSTIDSLLVLAASAYVRDYHQQIKNPLLPDNSLVRMSRITTIVLALVALGLVYLVVDGPKTNVFWFVIFGWSGISATFVPTMILSLFWRRFTRTGAACSMITGFLAVPIFSFAAPHWPLVGPYFKKLSELPPSVAAAFIVGIVVSLMHKQSAQAIDQAESDLKYAAGGDDAQ